MCRRAAGVCCGSRRLSLSPLARYRQCEVPAVAVTRSVQLTSPDVSDAQCARTGRSLESRWQPADRLQSTVLHSDGGMTLSRSSRHGRAYNPRTLNVAVPGILTGMMQGLSLTLCPRLAHFSRRFQISATTSASSAGCRDQRTRSSSRCNKGRVRHASGFFPRCRFPPASR